MTKRVLALLMCTVMIFSSVPFSPFGEFFDFALTAAAAEEGLKVTFAKIKVFEKDEGKLAPVVTYKGETVKSGVTYKWSSSDTSVATVSADGTVKGIKAGETDITVVASYKGESATYARPIEISKIKKISSLEADMSTSLTMIEKEEKKLLVRVLPTTATEKKLKWTSSDEKVVKIVSSGVDSENSKAYATVAAVAKGKATVTYTSTDGTNKTGSFTVTVKPRITSLSLPKHILLTTSTSSHIVDYSIAPSDAGKKTLIWSSDKSDVCTVNALGVISLSKNKNPGTCYVTAKTTDGSNLTAKTYVVVSDGTKSISLNKTNLDMTVGGKNVDLTASCVMKCGITYKDAVKWTSSNTDVATVDQVGVVTAKGPGKAKITATTSDGSNHKAECSVTVTQPVKGISLTEKETCWVGGTKTLTPVFNPTNASNKKVTWTSSDSSVATVSDKGVVTGKKVGTATITVKTADGGYTDTCKVSVEIAPKSVKLSDTSVTLKAKSSTGTTCTLKATVEPSNATNKGVTWTSSNTKVAKVSSSGKVTAVAGGTAVITCTTKSAGKKATCTVKVTEDAKSITITNAPDTSLYVGKTYNLKVDFNSETVTNKKIAWSSSKPKVITIDEKGKITATGVGNAVITVTYTTSEGKKITDKCTVFVDKKIKVTDVKIFEHSKKNVYVKVGTSVNLYADVIPSNASEKTISWSSKSKSVATVDSKSGVVKALKPGTSKIVAKAKDGDIEDYCVVHVIGPIEFKESQTKVAVGETGKLVLNSENPTDTKIKWTTSKKSVATVKNGAVKGVKAGTVTITATTPGGFYSASCKVKVVIPVTGVKINAKTITVPKGEKRRATVTVSPSNATEQDVVWSTPSESVPIIDINEAGQITGKRVGSTTATVTTVDGKYKDTVTVNVIQPVSSVDFEYSSITLDAGKKKTLTPQIKPINATIKDVKWSSSNKKIAKVDSKGVITAVSAGVATITCTSADGFAKETVKVTVTQPPTGIKFSSKQVSVKVNGTKKLKPVILPETASNRNVIYTSSNEKIAKVSTDGTVKGIKKGTAKITATTISGLYSATITVKVVKPVKSVSLNKTSVNIVVGKTTVITPTVSPKSASNKDVTWKSSDNDVVTVSKDGVVTAKAPGYAVVTCTSVDGKKKATCSVSVNQPLKGIKFKKSTVTIDIDETLTLKPTFKPSDASNKAVRWSTSNKKVVKVSAKGVLKPVSTGMAKITVTSVEGGYKATCTVKVVKKVKKVSIPKTLTVYLGEKETLKATLTPSKPTNKKVKWSTSNKKIATVSSKGVITPKKPGTVKITVTTVDGGLKATCKVTVKRAIKSFTLNKKTLSINKGASYTLKVSKKPTDATEKITFSSSNKKVATVSSKGVVKGIKKGTATITAKTEKGLTFKCKVTVKQPVTSVKISKTKASVYIGSKLTLSAKVLPENANSKTVKWTTSDKKIATVKDGVVTPEKTGKVTITAKSSNGKKATCTVTVKQHVTGISLNKKESTVTVGNTRTLKVTVKPSTATNKGYSFSSSDTKIATVTAEGIVKGIGPGTATITVKSKEGKKTATCKVKVVQKVKSVSLSNTEKTLYVETADKVETFTLKATVAPSNATTKTVKWSSSAPEIAKVSSKGVVTAVKAGTAVITVTTDSANKTAKCTVTVKQRVTGITLDKNSVSLEPGKTAAVKATVNPSNASNKGYSFSSSDTKIATVTASGEIKGIAPGTATITVRSNDNNKTATCKVTVVKKVASVTVSPTTKTLYIDKNLQGGTVQFQAVVYPADATNKSVTWSSSDTSVAKVSASGLVTAVKAGTAEITVTTTDGKKTDGCTIVVLQKATGISVEKSTFTVNKGQTLKINATVEPANANNKNILWEFEDDNIATVDEYGRVTGIAVGQTVVTAVSVDGGFKASCLVIVNEPVTGVKLDINEAELDKDQTVQLTETVYPDFITENINKDVIWSSSDSSVAKVEDGVVTAVGEGEAIITVKTVDGGFTDTCKVTVN